MGGLKDAKKVVGEALLRSATNDELQEILPSNWVELQNVSSRFLHVLEQLDPTYLKPDDDGPSLQQSVFALGFKPDVDTLCRVLTIESKIIIRWINGLRDDLQKTTENASDLAHRLRASDQQMDEERTEHRRAIHTNTQQAQIEKTNTRNQHQAEVSRLKHEHTSQLDRQAREHANKVNDMSHQQWLMQESHKSEVDNMKQKFDNEVAELQKVVENAEAKMHAHVEQLELNFATELGNKDSVIEQLKKTHAREMADLKKERDDREARVKKERDEREAGLQHRARQEISGLSQALIARDDTYKAPLLGAEDLRKLTDEDVKAQYMDIVRLVDDLARLKWKSNQQIWDEKALLDMNPKQNQRLLKKHILQDSIWFILHSYIFCSPFRCFGDEGKVLEKQWSQQSNTNDTLAKGEYTWPTPSIETERWRYITVKECQMALKQPLPSEYDPRAKLKKGFRANLEKLQSDLRGMLVEIVSLDDTEIQMIEHLTRKASSVWLSFGMQRCRIIMIFQASKMESPIEKSYNVSKGSLELDLNPRLGRYGNSKGDDLANFITIAGCDGDVVRLP